MNAELSMTGRWSRRFAGVALHALIWDLPTAAAALMILKLAGAHAIVGDPAGPAIFAALFVMITAALTGLVARKFPRLDPLGLGRVCFNDALSGAEKVDRLRQDGKVWQSLVTQGAFLSLLAILVLTLR
jgi:hypothetical protein